jgi:transcriptional regulator with XRE-family HTH domain
MKTKKEIRSLFLARLREIAEKRFGYQPGEDHGMRTDIANELKISVGTVQQWFDEEKETMPDAMQFLKIHDVFGITPNELLGVEDIKPREIILPIEITDDFASFPIQTFGSTAQANGRPLGQVVIHKRVFGRRGNLAAVRLDEEKIVIVGR